MTRDGKLSIGVAYIKRFAKLSRLTGKKDTQAVREIVDNVLYDAEQEGLSSIPIQRIGIKPAK